MSFRFDLTPADVVVPVLPAPGARASLHAWLVEGWQAAGLPGDLPSGGWQACPVPQADLTHAGALLAAKALRQHPRAWAQAWADALPPHPHVQSITVVGPGHLNLELSDTGWKALLADPGPFEAVSPQEPLLIEFVSANPTGPLHLGHARQAVLGDTLARLMRHAGHTVGTEFYTNDAGVQVDWLVQSVALRMHALQGVPLVFARDTPEGEPLPELPAGGCYFPRKGYHGDDIVALAHAARAAGLEGHPCAALKAFAIDFMSQNQRATLAQLRVDFDGLASEQALHASGQVQATVDALLPHAYHATHARQEADPENAAAQPAWFLDTVSFGDQKDRVMIKADGSVPYFVPDVAYHQNKWARGWTQALNIQGSDHHGTLARVQAGVQWLGLPANYPQALFHTMVSVIKEGVPVVASKREGTAIPAQVLMDQIGVDAFRMAMLDKNPETPLTVDVDTWTSEGLANPVYAVQYASTRLGSLLARCQAEDLGAASAPVWCPAERSLAKAILVWADRIRQAAEAHDPIRLAHAVRDLAGVVHAAQQAPRLLDLDAPSRSLRIPLFAAAKQAMDLGHHLLGLNVRERM